MRRGWGLTLLAMVVVLAGCGGAVPGSGDRGTGTTPTLTPAPVPEETGPAGGRLLGPGLSTNGVYDERALISSHRAELTDRGFVMVRNRTVFRPNATASSAETGTLNTVGITAVVEPGAGAYRFTRVERSTREWPLADSYSLIAVWYRDPLVRNRFVNEDRIERLWGQDRAASGGPILDPTDAETLGTDLSAVDLRVVGNETVDGTRVYRFRGSGFAPSSELVISPLLSSPHNATLVATIDEGGVVRAYTLTFDATFVGEPVRVRHDHRVTDVGSATVERPSWLPAANRSVSNAGG